VPPPPEVEEGVPPPPPPPPGDGCPLAIRRCIISKDLPPDMDQNIFGSLQRGIDKVKDDPP